MLLFFAAFGGTSVTDESVEEYMKRLMNEDKYNMIYGIKQECPFCKERTVAKRLLGFHVGSTEQVETMGM